MQASNLFKALAEGWGIIRKYLPYLLPTLLLLLIVVLFIYYTPRPVVISSASMKPAIAEGALALSLRVDPQQLQVGDIVVYRKVIPFSRTQVVAHRVVEVRFEGGIRTFKTKGDANEAPDSWDITPREVAGKVVLVVPKMGRVFLLIQRNLFAITLMMVGLGLFFLYIGMKPE